MLSLFSYLGISTYYGISCLTLLPEFSSWVEEFLWSELQPYSSDREQSIRPFECKFKNGQLGSFFKSFDLGLLVDSWVSYAYTQKFDLATIIMMRKALDKVRGLGLTSLSCLLASLLYKPLTWIVHALLTSGMLARLGNRALFREHLSCNS